jgi:hypothetical protein
MPPRPNWTYTHPPVIEIGLVYDQIQSNSQRSWGIVYMDELVRTTALVSSPHVLARYHNNNGL